MCEVVTDPIRRPTAEICHTGGLSSPTPCFPYSGTHSLPVMERHAVIGAVYTIVTAVNGVNDKLAALQRLASSTRLSPHLQELSEEIKTTTNIAATIKLFLDDYKDLTLAKKSTAVLSMIRAADPLLAEARAVYRAAKAIDEREAQSAAGTPDLSSWLTESARQIQTLLWQMRDFHAELQAWIQDVV